jgi:hypothetical protein
MPNHYYAYSNIVRVTQFGEPVAIRPEMQETEPAHADMLRYDLAFCNPADPSMIVFPQFKTRQGKLGGKVTIGRWDSFCMRLAIIPEEAMGGAPDISEWFTYEHSATGHGLHRVTFAEYVQAHRDYRLTCFAGYLPESQRK